jgi:hypothetical protein
VWRFLAASLLIGFAVFGGIYPVLFNLYLLRLGYGPPFIGLINALILLGYAVGCLPAGALCRTYGVRQTLLGGMWAILLGYGLQPWAELIPEMWRTPWLLVNGLVGALGLALFLTASNPFLMRNTTALDRPYAYMARSALSLLGGFVGSIIAGWLPGSVASLFASSLEAPGPFRWSLLLAAVLLLPGIWAIWRIPKAQAEGVPEIQGLGKDSGEAKAPTVPWAVILILALVELLVLTSEGAGRTFFNLYLDDGLAVPVRVIGAVMASAQLLAVPAVLSAPLLVRRWGNGTVVTLCSLAMALGILLLGLIPRWGAAGVSYILLLAAAQVRVAVIPMFQMHSVPVQWQPAMSAVAGTALGFSWSLTAMGGGWVVSRWSYRALFWGTAVVTFVGTVVFLWFVMRRRTLDSM